MAGALADRDAAAGRKRRRRRWRPRSATSSATPQCTTGKVKLDIPPLVENGNTVPMTVSVASPMTAERLRQEHPRLQREEPAAQRRQFLSGPRAGRAQVSTRIRLADTQKVVAIANCRDGSFWSVTADVVVTLAACTEEVI